MEKKFKLKADVTILVKHAPHDFTIHSAGSAPYDRVIVFVHTIDAMIEELKALIAQKAVKEQGYVFLCYPKKGNKQFDTYIARDDLFPNLKTDENRYVLGSTIKFNSLLSLDDTYTILALKNETKTPAKAAGKPSQRVGDYEKDVTKIVAHLQQYPDTLAFYNSLTPGYRNDWARYVYSAKREATQAQRLQEMVDILDKGFKTKELYRQHLKGSE